MDADVRFMKEALKEARKAFLKDEVPVGCVIVKGGKVIARAHNQREGRQDATAHAELLCIKKACKKLGSFRLNGCELYVTLEPCPMCAGAIINARVERAVFGAYDPKAGCCGTLYDLLGCGKFNHTLKAVGGVMEEECSDILKRFFAEKRRAQRELNCLTKGDG
ncbi:MAG: nucleoside deaminase [Clostridiales bacterium]|jgi:tRNA(adenine34) deaminase|nr:nucleoside deaminase [Clostridiales bacterium]